jgi:hypothetical protein
MSYFWHLNLSEKKWVFIILTTSFVFRIGYSFFVFDPLKFNDDWDYIHFAESILNNVWQGASFPSDSKIVGPIWPIVIACCFNLFGKIYWPIVGLNVIMSTATVYLIYRLGKELTGKQNIALLIATWSVFYVHFVKEIPSLLKESFLQFFFPLLILQFLLAIKSSFQFKKLLIFSLIYSILIHADERYFFYFPFLGFGFLCLDCSREWHAGLKKAFVFIFFVSFSMIPWLVRNYQFYGRIVILTERTTPITNYVFGYPPLKGEGHIYPYDRANLPLYEEITDSIKQRKEITSNPKKIKYIDQIPRAINLGINVHSFTPRKHYWEEFKELWRPVRFKPGMVANGYRLQVAWKPISNFVYGVQYGLLLPFLFGMLIWSVKQGRKEVLFLYLILGVHTIIHVFLAHARQRYRIPVDPIVIVVGGWGIMLFFFWIRRFFQLHL